MYNIWFYTLSTSAQALAALAGLFAMFVLWKIQELDKNIIDIRYAVIGMLPYLSENTKDFENVYLKNLYLMLDMEILEKFSELLLIKIDEPHRISVSMTIKGGNLISYSLDELTESIYRNLVNKKISILNDLKKILIVNFMVIGVCIIVLTFSSIIHYKFIFLVIISIAVLYSLYLISSGIYRITAR